MFHVLYFIVLRNNWNLRQEAQIALKNTRQDGNFIFNQIDLFG